LFEINTKACPCGGLSYFDCFAILSIITSKGSNHVGNSKNEQQLGSPNPSIVLFINEDIEKHDSKLSFLHSKFVKDTCLYLFRRFTNGIPFFDAIIG